MSQQRFAVFPAVCGTLLLIGWVAALSGLGAGIHNGSAPSATPQAAATAEDGRVSFSDRFSDWASLGAALSDSHAVLPPAAPTAASKPAQDDGAAAPPVETARTESIGAAVPEPQILPPAAPPAVASEPVRHDLAAAPPVETARTESIGAAVPEPQILPPAAPPALASEPVQYDLAAAPPVETAATGNVSGAVPEPRMLPPETPPAASTPDPVQDIAAAGPVGFALASAGAPAPEPQLLPPVTIADTPDPVQDVVEAAPPPVEVAALGHVDAAVSDPGEVLRPVAIAPASAPDPVDDDVEAAAPPVETAALDGAGAAVPRPPVRLVSLFRPAQPTEDLAPAVRPVETPNECLVAEICIDDYLWSYYERTPKVDTNKVTQRVKATIRKKGKTRTITRTVTRYVLGDFTWKDPVAAQRAGMPLKDYVIGGMDRRFKLKLYHALRAMDDAGLMPGITSAFRDDYRQAIATGNKAASDSSYHGGSRRGGYGYGLAADLVSVKGDTRMQRWASTVELWKWIDEREMELGIGRPYLQRDPPHVGPIDGKEFAAKRGGAKAKRVGSPARKQHPVVAGNPGVMNPATKPAPVRVGSI